MLCSLHYRCNDVHELFWLRVIIQETKNEINLLLELENVFRRIVFRACLTKVASRHDFQILSIKIFRTTRRKRLQLTKPIVTHPMQSKRAKKYIFRCLEFLKFLPIKLNFQCPKKVIFFRSGMDSHNFSPLFHKLITRLVL